MQAVAGEHGAQEAGGLAYVPTGHEAAVNAQEVAPAALYAPAGQLKHDGAPAALKVPAGHGWHAEALVAPAVPLKAPAGQNVQAAAPAALCAPAGQGAALAERGGQKEPAGHSAGAPPAQKYEAGQGTQVSCRTRRFPQSAA